MIYTPTPEEQAMLERVGWRAVPGMNNCWESGDGALEVWRFDQHFFTRPPRGPAQMFPTLMAALVWLAMEGYLR